MKSPFICQKTETIVFPETNPSPFTLPEWNIALPTSHLPAKIPLTRNNLSLILDPAVININDIKKIAFI